MAAYYVTTDPKIVATRIVRVPVSGESARIMSAAFSDALGVGVTVVKKRGAGFSFYEGTLQSGVGRIAFIPVAMVNDLLHRAGVTPWY